MTIKMNKRYDLKLFCTKCKHNGVLYDIIETIKDYEQGLNCSKIRCPKCDLDGLETTLIAVKRPNNHRFI